MKRRQRIKPVSEKRQRQLDEYKLVRIEYLTAHKKCEVKDCNNDATDIHHMRGRSGDRLNDTDEFLAICRECHGYIEEHPAWAKAKGYSRSRLGI